MELLSNNPVLGGDERRKSEVHSKALFLSSVAIVLVIVCGTGMVWMISKCIEYDLAISKLEEKVNKYEEIFNLIHKLYDKGMK